MMTLWKPTFRWQFITLGISLLVCLLAFGVLYVITEHLPAPYQPRTVSADITPWNK